MSIDPKDLREGDRVRITLEGEFIRVDADGDFHFRLKGQGYKWFDGETLCHAGIIRLGPPIRVGDRVKDGDLLATVKAIDGDEAWLLYDGGDRGTELLSVLTRISENPQ